MFSTVPWAEASRQQHKGGSLHQQAFGPLVFDVFAARLGASCRSEGLVLRLALSISGSYFKTPSQPTAVSGSLALARAVSLQCLRLGFHEDHAAHGQERQIWIRCRSAEGVKVLNVLKVVSPSGSYLNALRLCICLSSQYLRQLQQVAKLGGSEPGKETS